MSKNGDSVFQNIQYLLQQEYRGINLAVYGLTAAGLAFSIHKVRPVSKFSKASKIPNHFIRNHEPMKGVFDGVQHSPVRVLINHRAPIYLPLWHSSKPPLPVKLWGVDIVSGNAINWLECVAKGQKVTLKPIARENEDLVSTVVLHLPQAKNKTQETLDIGQKLVELGLAKTSVPAGIKKKTIESQIAPTLLSAEARAKSYRSGLWSDQLPPLPLYVIYWRKGSKLASEILVFMSKKLFELLIFVSKSAFIRAKRLALRPFRKPLQTSSVNALK